MIKGSSEGGENGLEDNRATKRLFHFSVKAAIGTIVCLYRDIGP